MGDVGGRASSWVTKDCTIVGWACSILSASSLWKSTKALQAWGALWTSHGRGGLAAPAAGSGGS
eukprot:5831251-Alexandrium_andersonii.AAC.1